MRSEEYKRELRKLNEVAWSFYRRYVCHQLDKRRTSIEKTMKIILKHLEYLIEESERIGGIKIEKERKEKLERLKY